MTVDKRLPADHELRSLPSIEGQASRKDAASETRLAANARINTRRQISKASCQDVTPCKASKARLRLRWLIIDEMTCRTINTATMRRATKGIIRFWRTVRPCSAMPGRLPRALAEEGIMASGPTMACEAISTRATPDQARGRDP